MTSTDDDAVAEAAHWNYATNPAAIWGEPVELWDEGVEHCSQQIARCTPDLLTSAPYWKATFDLGCGIGRLTLPMRQRWGLPRVVGYDVSSEMVNRASLAALVAYERDVEFVESDGRTIPARDGSFDFGWSVLLFQHIPPDAQRGYLAEAHRVLRPGGRFVVQVDAASETGGEFLHWHTSTRDLLHWWPQLGCPGSAWMLLDDERYPQWAWLAFTKGDA